VAKEHNPDLIRIPNNSLLGRKVIEDIAAKLKASCEAAYTHEVVNVQKTV
jgi:hypothetical protein